MSRLTLLTCDCCGKAITLPELADLPDDWVEVSWSERIAMPSLGEDDDFGMSATFCGWRCASVFCSRMITQHLLLMKARRPS